MIILKWIVIACSVLLFSGCVKNADLPALPKGEYAPHFDYESDKRILIALRAQDRKAVTEMKEKRSFFYHSHGTFGELSSWHFNKVFVYKDLGADDNYTLTEVLGEKVEYAAHQSFTNVKRLYLDEKPTKEQLVSMIKEHDADKFLFINVNEWYGNEIFFSMVPKFDFMTDVDLIVMNKDGSIAYERNEKAHTKPVHKFVPRLTFLHAYQVRMNEILNNYELKMALSQ